MLIKLLFYTTALIISIIGYRAYRAPNSLKIGDNAPHFSLRDAKGKTHALSDYAGQYLVLYFYPKNDTPGCTKEACLFRDDMAALEALGAKVVGVSVDSAESHAAFSEKYHLPFPLLSDPKGEIAERYDALINLFVFKAARRYTFLISPTGKIIQIYKSVNTSKHSQEIIDDLKATITT